MLPDDLKPLLILGFLCRLRSCRKLKHNRLLARLQIGQKDHLAIRQLDSVMVGVLVVLINLPERRSLSRASLIAFRPATTGIIVIAIVRLEDNRAREDNLGARKNTDCGVAVVILGCPKAPTRRANEVGRNELFANRRRAGLGVQ